MIYGAISLILDGHCVRDVIDSLLEMTVKPTKGIIRGASQYVWDTIKRGDYRPRGHLPTKVVRPKKLVSGAKAFVVARGK